MKKRGTEQTSLTHSTINRKGTKWGRQEREEKGESWTYIYRIVEDLYLYSDRHLHVEFVFDFLEFLGRGRLESREEQERELKINWYGKVGDSLMSLNLQLHVRLASDS